LQYLLGKRLETKAVVFDMFIGVGLRAFARKSWIRKDVYYYSLVTTNIENQDWKYPYFFPSIQFGIEIGIK
jgi:hypothetical protein